jgi:hypothetical protein
MKQGSLAEEEGEGAMAAQKNRPGRDAQRKDM